MLFASKGFPVGKLTWLSCSLKAGEAGLALCKARHSLSCAEPQVTLSIILEGKGSGWSPAASPVAPCLCNSLQLSSEITPVFLNQHLAFVTNCVLAHEEEK